MKRLGRFLAVLLSLTLVLSSVLPLALAEEEPVVETTAPEENMSEPEIVDPEPAAEQIEEPAEEPAAEPAEEPMAEPAEEPESEEAPSEDMPEQVEEPAVEETEEEEQPVILPDAPKVVLKKAWVYNKEDQTLIIPCEASDETVTIEWEFARNAGGYLIEIADIEKSPEKRAELGFVASNYMKLPVADYMDGWYKLYITAVLEDGTPICGEQIFRLDVRAEEEAESESAAEPTDLPITDEATLQPEAEVTPIPTEEPVEPQPTVPIIAEVEPEPTKGATQEPAPALEVSVVQVGETTLQAIVSGGIEGEISYRWQALDSVAYTEMLMSGEIPDVETLWEDVPGATEAVLDVKAVFGEKYADYSYRCVAVTGALKAISTIFRFTEKTDIPSLMAASPNGPYSSLIRSTYQKCYNRNGGSFSGWCGQYVRYQLEALGINYVTTTNNFNGNEVYYGMVDGAVTKTGFTQYKYAGNNCLYDIITDFGSKAENIVVSWKHQSGYTNSNPGYGHTNFIYGIVNNVVYYSESFSGWQVAEGEPQQLSVAEFMSRYNGTNGDAIGAIIFSKTSPSISTVSTLQFTNITYPKTFRINTTNGWILGSGTVESNSSLKTIRSQILNSSGSTISDSGIKSISGTRYAIKNLDTYSSSDNGVKFSYIKTAGSYKWVLTATDSSGRTLTLTMPFTAASSGSTATSSTALKYVDVTGITLNNTSTQVHMGLSVKLSATIAPSNATEPGVNWTTSDSKIATVSSDGTVTGISAGFATITCAAKVGSVKTTCSVEVIGDVAIYSVSANPTTATVGSNTVFYVTTGADAKHLQIRNENGNVVSEYGVSYSSLSADKTSRYWTVDYVFDKAGYRNLAFKAWDENYQYSGNIDFLIQVNEQVPSVTSVATSPKSAMVGQAMTFTVKTSAGAKYLAMYNEKGALSKTWSASSSTTSTSGSVMTWTLPYTFGTAGNRNLSMKASADNVTYGNAKAFTITVQPALSVTSVATSPKSAMVGQTMTFTVQTSAGANYLAMYNESGALSKTWSASSSTTKTSGSVRIWTLPYTFGTAGERKLSMKASADNVVYGNAKAFTLTVSPALSVTSVSASPKSVMAGQAMTFTVKTSAGAKYLAMYNEKGDLSKTWAANNSTTTTSGSVMTWTLPYTFGTAGDRKLSMKASADNVVYGNAKAFTLTVQPALSVTSITASPASAMVGQVTKFTVKMSASAKYLALCNEKGAIAKTWTASSSNTTTSGSVKTWTLSYTFTTAGNRNLSMKVSADDVVYGNGKAFSLTVSPALSVTSVSASPTTVTVGKAMTFTVKTSAGAKYLSMYNEKGALSKTWTASSSNTTTSESVMTWTLTYTFGTAGDRNLSMKASADNLIYGSAKAFTLKVK